MGYIGVIAAMEQELSAIVKIMQNVKTEKIYDKEFLIGKIGGSSVVASLSGVGKVNAARTAQILIDKFAPEYVVNVGSAGALQVDLSVGDIVLSSDVVQADFDITAFGHEKGYISGIGKHVKANGGLIEKFKKAIEILPDTKVFIGTVATGDKFVSNGTDKAKIGKEFDALCCEMEGGAVAQVCYLSQIPFIIIRSISDDLYSKAEIDFEIYLEKASVKCAEFLNTALKIN